VPRIRITPGIFYKILKHEGIEAPPLGCEKRLSSGAYLLKVSPSTCWIISNDKDYGDLPEYVNWKGSNVKHVLVGPEVEYPDRLS